MLVGKEDGPDRFRLAADVPNVVGIVRARVDHERRPRADDPRVRAPQGERSGVGREDPQYAGHHEIMAEREESPAE